MRDEVMADKSWRPLLQRRLQRLHSLMLGAELAMEQQAWERALGLNFRLLRFLECECETVADRLYVAPIRKKVLEMAESAKQEIYSMIERNTFAQAGGLAERTVFSDYGDFDIGTTKNSKYFECLRWDRDGVSRYTQSSPERELCNGILTSSKPKRQLAPPKMAATLAPKVDLQVKKFVQSTIQTCYENADAIGENIFSHSVMSPLTVFSQEGEESEQLRFGIKRARDSKGPDLDSVKSTGFVTAKKKWALDSVGKGGSPASLHLASTGFTSTNKTLGVPRRGIRNSFVPPVRQNGSIGVGNTVASAARSMENDLEDSTRKCLELLSGPNGELPDKLRNLEPRLLEHISNEIMEKDSNVRWDDIGGLEHAKKSVTEMVIWPLLRPDIFQGCRAPGKGLLLFGPPGTGKTMIGKAIAGEANATFFSISASSLTSKWIGEGEKLVRALFGVATCRQPAVIFIDEIDSLLSQRKADGEHESSRRLKTQFLIEMEGIGSGNEQLLLIGATNRPQELDEAARRRFTKRLYIPLPSAEARAWIVRNLLLKDGLLSLSDADIASICARTEGYSGSDVKNLVKEASLGPLREVILEGKDISKINASEMRPITIKDFCVALHQVRPSVSQDELGIYEEWNHQFGSLSL